MADKTNMMYEYYRIPEGAVKSGTPVSIYLKIERRSAHNPSFCTENEHSPMKWVSFEKGFDIYKTVFTPETGLYFFKFKIDIFELDGGQITVYDKSFTTPDWIYGGLIYHIMVDRFCRSGDTPVRDDAIFHENKDDTPLFSPDENGIVKNNDFFGGNLKGIEDKLDYLSSLGVSAIYLSPVFKSFSNHKYDTGNYLEIDPMFGTEADLVSLCKEAKKRGIRIILDGVFSHTGDDSVYFNKYGNYDSVGAYQSESSPYRSWYNIRSKNDYDCWWGISTLPTVNKNEPTYIEFIKNVLTHWQSKGVSSWRLDVADELTDPMLDNIRIAAKGADPESLIIGEVWEDASNKIAYGKRRHYLLGSQLDSVMNYPLRSAIINFVKFGDAGGLKACIETIMTNYPPPVINCLMNIIGTHDTERILTVLGSDKTFSSKTEMAEFSLSEEEYSFAVRRLKLASFLQMFLPGVPSIYYGDEAGMQGLIDPFNRKFFPWGKENTDILSHYRKIIKFRKNSPVFKEGLYKTEYAANGIFIFKRYDETGSLTLAANASSSPHLLFTRIYDMLNGEYTDTLNPYGFVIYGEEGKNEREGF